MKIIETKNLIFEDYTDAPYFRDLVSYTNKHEQEIFDFFKLKELPSKWRVKFLPFKEFKNYIILNYGKYEDYISGQASAHEKTVYILNVEDRNKYTNHKGSDVETVSKVLVHEFVHVCYAEVLPNFITWFNEGLATYLSHQDSELKDISDVDLTVLKNNFKDIPSKDRYTYSYYIVRYLIENYSKEEVYKLTTSRDYLIEKQNDIFEETKKWIKNQLDIKEKNKPIS